MKNFKLRKRLILVILIACFSNLSFAQSTDEEIIGVYTIKLISNDDKSFGYEIYKNGEIRVKQIRKAYLNTSNGFVIKENAMKIARWEVGKIEQNKKDSEKLDIEKAKELGVTEEDLK